MRRASWAGWSQRAAASGEEDKRNHSVVQRLLNEAGNHTIFTPIVMSACGAMGPSMVAFLKEVYGRAKEADKLSLIHI